MKFNQTDVAEAHQKLMQKGCQLRPANDYGTHGTFVEIRGEGANLVVSRPFDNRDEPRDWHQVRYYVDSPTIMVQEGDEFRWAGLQGDIPLDPITRHEHDVYYRCIPRFPSLLERRWQTFMGHEREKRAMGWLPFAEARHSLYKRWRGTWGILAFWLALHMPERMLKIREAGLT